MEGIYKTKVNTPFGTVDGRLTLKMQQDELTGTIEALGMRSNFTKGTVEGNACQFSGVIQSMIGAIQYEATGTVENGQMRIVANTNKGKFEFVGQKQ